MSALAAANPATNGGAQTKTGHQVPRSRSSNHNYNAHSMSSDNLQTVTDTSNNKNMRTRTTPTNQQVRQHQAAATTINSSQRVDRTAEVHLNRQRPASSMASRPASVMNSSMSNSSVTQQHQQANGICGEQWSSPEMLLSVSKSDRMQISQAASWRSLAEFALNSTSSWLISLSQLVKTVSSD